MESDFVKKDLSATEKYNKQSILDFPNEILFHIISYLPKDEVFWTIGLTCKKLFLISCEETTVLKIRNDSKASDATKLQELSGYLETVESVSQIIVWSYPEDYFHENESLGQNFRKFPEVERRYYIEKTPTIRQIPGITVIFTIEDYRRNMEYYMEYMEMYRKGKRTFFEY